MKRQMTSLLILVISLITYAAGSTITVATFDDPTADSTTPMFTVDFTVGLGVISGGWASAGLDLDVLNSATYPDAKFSMSRVNLTADTDPFFGTKTEGGTITFSKSDDTPLLEIEFDSGWVSMFGIGAIEDAVVLQGNNVSITGPALGGLVLSEESFAFSFTNHVPLTGGFGNGFTTTAAFTSSAVPEPATIVMLAIGAFGFIRRK